MLRAAAAVLLAIFALALPLASHAQNFTGSIRGTVTDPQGAAVAGADVTVMDTATNAEYKAKTSDSGEYVIPSLPGGTYQVRIKAGSFKEFLVKSVELHVANVTEVNAKLELGASTETVTVEATDVQVQTTSAAIGEVVDGTQVRELPLNGRNFIQLTQLQPGVSAANSFDSKDKGLQGGVDFSVNGNPYTNNLFLIDGANNNDVGSNRTILIYPSVDAIAEFKMLRNAYGPEYGQASGAVISITTRSGANQFHGTALYFGRNDALNATEFFANRNGTGKDKLRRNDYGYNFSGPIKKDKIFFFWSQEWNKEIRGNSRAACVATKEEAAGDFSLAFAGANATDQCGGARPNIPLAAQAAGNPLKFAKPSPAGLLLAQNYPLPNRTTPIPGTNNNWATSIPSKIDWREESIRADYDLTKRHRLTFRYTQDSWVNPAPNAQTYWGDDPFPAVEGNWNQPSKSVIGKLSSTITNTLINDVEFAYANNRIAVTTGGTNPALATQLAAAIPTEFPSGPKLPGAIPTLWGGLQNYGSFNNLWLISPFNNAMDLYTVRDDISKVRGNHTWKAGAFFSFNSKNEDQFGGDDRPSFGSPDWGTSSGATGNPLANVLNPQAVFSMSENSINPTDHGKWHDVEFYVGDTWKIRRNLTLEYGFRWSFLREPYEANDQMASFDPRFYDPKKPASDACNGVVVVPGTDPCGAANKANGTSFSSGTPGINRALVENNNHNIAPRIGIAWDPRGNGKMAVRVGVGQFYQRERVSPQVGLTNSAPFVVNATLNRPLDSTVPLSGAATSPNDGRSSRGVTPNSWQWNLAVEHELWRDAALEVAYVGNKGIHLTSTYDINQVLPANRLAAAFQQNGGLNALRPLPNFGSINFFSRDGWSTYHSLQALFRMKFHQRSSLQASYTWSHSIADVELDNSSGGASQGSFTDITNQKFDKGNSTVNRPHIFVLSNVWFLPELRSSGAFVRETAGGWEFNTIVTAESGNSITIFQNGIGDGANLRSLSGTGYSNNQRPNLSGTTSCNSGAHDFHIFNPNAFTLVGYQIGTIGNAPRGYCHGPNQVNADLEFSKNWSLSEKLRLKFSLDMFNAFNHAQFLANTINTAWNSGNVSCGTSACSPTNNVITASPVNGQFGQASKTRGGRELQYSLKFTF